MTYLKNPFAETADNESLYINDPKKALQNWYVITIKFVEKGLKKGGRGAVTLRFIGSKLE